ncbi:MAG: hypothetical protein HKN13_07525, partial [Rhodothermales bacterium]|nr:hypothetical protein [Rhodothermales bacterium]
MFSTACKSSDRRSKRIDIVVLATVIALASTGHCVAQVKTPNTQYLVNKENDGDVSYFEGLSVQLEQAALLYQSIARGGGFPVVSTLRDGGDSTMVLRTLRARLCGEFYDVCFSTTGSETLDSPQADSALHQALTHFQRYHGLEP